MIKYLSTILVLCFFSWQLNAQLEVRFSGDTIPASGSTVDVDVVVSNFTDIVSFQFSINWDPTVFNYNSIEDVTTVLAQFSEAGNIGTPPGAVVVDDGELTVSWSLSSTEPVSIPDGTKLFTLRLFGIGANCTSTSLGVSNDPLMIEVVNQDFEVIDLNTNVANLLIDDGTCDGGGGGTDGVGLIVDAVSAPQGTNICIPVTTDNFNDIASLQSGVRWDPTVLRFTGLNDRGLSGVTANRSNEAAGELAILWVFENEAVTLAKGATLFELCFDVIGNTGSTTEVRFQNIPTLDIEIADVDARALPFFVIAGTITVGSGTGGGEDGVGLIGGMVFTGNATEVCVPITTKAFNNVAALQLGVSFDESVLRYKESKDGGLKSVQVGSGNAATGELRVLWTVDLSSNSVTLADDAVLFELCFDVIGDIGETSPIGFINIPNLPIEVVDEDAVALDFFIRDGLVTIGNDPNGSRVTLTASNLVAENGDTACINISVMEFTNIQGLGFTIQWDSTVLRHIRQQNFNLPNLAGGTTNFNKLGESQLRLVWTPPSAQTVPNGTSIFQVCYEAIGDCEDEKTSAINFIGNNGGSVEVIDNNSQALPVTLIAGSVKIDSCRSSSINLLSVTNPSCAGAVDGAVAIELIGLVGTAMCSWTDASGTVVSTSCNLVGVGVGSYTITASDDDMTRLTRTFQLVEPAPIGVTANITDVTCLRGGSIALTATGGTSGAFNYAWSGGLPSGAMVSNLSAGTFSVTVTRENPACALDTSFIVGDQSGILTLDDVTVINCPSDGNNGEIQLTIGGGDGNYSYTTSIGTVNSSGRVQGVGTDPITVIVTDGGGCQMMFEDIDFADQCGVVIADCSVARTIISPNGDNSNDVFEIGCLNGQGVEPNRLEIYDRWGKLVFGADNYDNSWDGTDMSGQQLNEGGYMWVLQTGGAGSRDLFRGTVTILR